MPPRSFIVAFVAAATLAAAQPARALPGGPEADATALGVRVTVPGAAEQVVALVAAPPGGEAHAQEFAFSEDAVRAGPVSASAFAAAATRADDSAAASVDGVSLFGGEIAVERVSVTASAGAARTRAGGSLELSVLAGVRLLGQSVDAVPNTRVALGDWGYVVLLEERFVSADAGATGFAGAVAGLRVRLTADHGGLPAGTEIVVGYAQASASVAPAVVEGGAAQEAPPEESAGPVQEPEPQPAGARPVPPPIVLDPPPEIGWSLSSSSYVFPVYGPASFGWDFAVPRPDVGWHHGSDIFAAAGAPVVAVADGELFQVGWNELGGQRVWLKDDRGNEFYYAHLSAYSPLAYEGSRVRAGDVIGFVGTTGDAVGTLPHLHFEIHPAQLRGLGYDGVIDPHRQLATWRRLSPGSFGEFLWSLSGKAPQAAVVLLAAQDISTVVGLEAEAVARVLAPPSLFGEAPLVSGG
jgi:murein DD-endopeptidase MepM/ murein hydrolase activator NlpD